MKKRLTIIILNYNTARLLEACVNSIVKFTKNLDYEIVIVDNASTEKESLSLLAKLSKSKNILIIKNKTNLGFAKACNQGLKHSNSDYVLLLNSDTYFTKDILSEFLNWMDDYPKIGIASAGLKNRDGSTQGTGGYFPNLFRIWSWMLFLDDLPIINRLINPFHPHIAFYNKIKQIDWITGAFFMIRREVVENVGFLDEDYFMYVEDTDYCFRAKRAGWQIYYNPKFNIVHLGGQSSGKEFPIVSEFKALKLFYKKHKPSWQGSLLTVAFKLGCILRIFVFGDLYKKVYAQI